MPKLTKKVIDGLEIKTKDYIVFDSEISGFGLRVFPSGKKNFLLQYRFQGQTNRFKIGICGVLTVDEARKSAINLLSEINKGINPQKQKSEYRIAPTLKEFGVRFIKDHINIRLKPRTQTEWVRALNKWIYPIIGNKKVIDITRADIASLHQSMYHVPYQANRCKEILSKMMNLAELWGVRPENNNPCRLVKKYKEEKRMRFLTPEEFRRLGQTLTQMEEEGEAISPIHCIKLLMLTGCRLSEIWDLRWDFIDSDRSEIHLPDSKTGAKIVYVGEAVIAFLKHIYNHPERPLNNPWVIWGTLENAKLTDMQKPWRRIRKRAGLDDLRIHDLRHSFASSAVMMGKSLPMIGKLLGHTQVQTTARYAHIASTPAITAAIEVSNNIYQMISGC